MFTLDVPAWNIVLRTAAIYVVILLGLRLAGKREIGQMTVFDLVVLLLIANAVQNAMVGPDTSLTRRGAGGGGAPDSECRRGPAAPALAAVAAAGRGHADAAGAARARCWPITCAARAWTRRPWRLRCASMAWLR